MQLFTNSDLEQLQGAARSSKRGRKHHNLHRSFCDPCQRLVNCLSEGTYIQPHLHDSSQGSETLIILDGCADLVIFNTFGDVTSLVRLDRANADAVVAAVVAPFSYHTVVSWSPNTALLEVKAGPFNPDNPKHLAEWAPSEHDEKSHTYLESLKNGILNGDKSRIFL